MQESLAGGLEWLMVSNMDSTGGIRGKAGGMGGVPEACREVLEACEGIPEHEV
jgi:hypothetical protein